MVIQVLNSKLKITLRVSVTSATIGHKIIQHSIILDCTRYKLIILRYPTILETGESLSDPVH